MSEAFDSWRDLSSRTAGVWSLRSVGDGIDIAVGADDVHPSASVIKVPILSTLLDLVTAGQLALNDRVPVADDDIGGSGALKYLALESVTLQQALALMITISDNVATNALIEHVGMAELNSSWARRGYGDFRLNRLLGRPPRTPEEDNYATAQASVDCLLDLDARASAGERAAQLGLTLLAEQQVRDRIPAEAPPDLECLNKTGELPGVRHDIGLLRRGNATVAVAMMASGVPDVGASTGGGIAASVMGRTAAALARDLVRP